MEVVNKPGAATAASDHACMMVAVRVADLGVQGASPGSGAGAQAGCGAEPREEILDDLGLKK